VSLTIQYDEKQPIPRDSWLLLECDAATEFFCRGFARFDDPDGFIGAHRAAMAAGWLERQAPSGRLWLCPACSGKV
jgi:hypothetical protein